MKQHIINARIFSMTAIFFCTSSIAGTPEWSHQEQMTWGALDDSTQVVVPLMYPYAECSLGSHQSPVNLSATQHEKSSNQLRIEYKQDTSPDFFNSGHAAQVNLPVNYPGKLLIGKDAYPLVQFHLHAPAEHAMGSKTYPAELHFVHIRADGKMAVLGVLLDDQSDMENPELQKILDNVPTTPSKHNTISSVQLQLESLLPKRKSPYFSYAGSLTTPPCSEGVNWYVLFEPLKVSKSQIAELESFSQYLEYGGQPKPNNRILQNLNERTVEINSR